MTVHTPANAAEPGGRTASPPSLTRLRVREAALRQQAAQLHARAEHLERVGRAQARQLQRRVDTHEKIVLGALVKKAGLDLPLPPTSDAERQPNDGQATQLLQGVASQSIAYDRTLILGALMWLTSALNQTANDSVAVPEWDRLRDSGRRALEHPRQKF